MTTQLLFIENLPPQVGKGTVFRLLLDETRVRKEQVGRIQMAGNSATIEIAGDDLAPLVRRLDGLLLGTRRLRVWRSAQAGEQPHFDRLLRWLELEAEAEKAQLASREGDARSLENLVVRGEAIGLGGRILLRLGLRNEQAPLPSSALGVGAPVVMSAAGESWRGVIARRDSRTISVAFTQAPEVAGTVRLDLAQDEIARRRIGRALQRAATADGRLRELRDVLLGRQPAAFRPVEPLTTLPGDRLNRSQQAALQRALAAEDVAVIHGPPGTGKTTTVVELIIAAVARGERVLACAPSNLAVDNLVERLAQTSLSIVRIGDPIRVLPAVYEHTLDHLVESHGDYRLAQKLRKDAFALQRDADRWKRARPRPGETAAKRAEAVALFGEARQLEQTAVERILDGAQVTLATLTGIDSTLFGRRRFDLCVIDEAGQSTEAASWIPITRADKLVLAGDHQQLPPTIISQQAQQEGFGCSLLEQLMARDGDDLARQLIVQYRMHETIMGFSSAEFYDGTLQAAESVAGHLLADLPHVTATPATTTPLTFIDTAGAGYDEELTANFSRRNPQEATLVQSQLEQLLGAGVLAEQIVVITPYSAQVDTLRDLLAGVPVEVGSIDAMQGREQEAVIISLVRSNYDGQIGFLQETRRMNVALTRARRKLIVIGDSATIAVNGFYERFIDYCQQVGAYQSVWEL